MPGGRRDIFREKTDHLLIIMEMWATSPAAATTVAAATALVTTTTTIVFNTFIQACLNKFWQQATRTNLIRNLKLSAIRHVVMANFFFFAVTEERHDPSVTRQDAADAAFSDCKGILYVE